jgi:hypothetical protein
MVHCCRVLPLPVMRDLSNHVWRVQRQAMYQREGIGLLEYQALRDVAHYGVLCTFSNWSAPDRGKWCSVSGQAAWIVHHVQNHTLLGHSPSAARRAAVLGQPSSLRPHCMYVPAAGVDILYSVHIVAEQTLPAQLPSKYTTCLPYPSLPAHPISSSILAFGALW